MNKSKRRWRHRRGDNYHYYENELYGLGHVIKSRADGLYHATGKRMRSDTFKTLREARRFVEMSWRKS